MRFRRESGRVPALTTYRRPRCAVTSSRLRSGPPRARTPQRRSLAERSRTAGSRCAGVKDHANSSGVITRIPPCDRGAERVDGVAVGAHAVAVAVDRKDSRVVQQAVEDGGGDGGVVEDVAPVDDVAVGGEHDGAVFVAAADDLEEVA